MSKIVKCKRCNADISSTAAVCPSCGAKTKTSIFKKWWFWVIIGVVVIAIVAGASGSDEPTKETGGSTNASSTTDSGTKQEDETFKINDTAVFKTLKITANKLEESKGDGFNEAPEGKTYVGVNFTIENISDEDQAVSSLLLFDAYIDGVKLDYSFSASMAFDEGTIDGTISPDKKMVGWYAVEVPEDWKELELQVKSDWLSNTKARFVFNK